MKYNRKKGFTLIELIIVIAILGILSLIAIPKYMDMQENAKNKTIEYNSSIARKQILLFIDNYPEDKIYYQHVNYSTAEDEFYLKAEYLSQCLEQYWEDGVEQYNDDYYQNPYSGKSGVVNWNTLLTNEQYRQHAFFITGTSAYSYDNFSLSATEAKQYLQGTIIIYMDNVGNPIDIYYIDGDGKKSDFHLTVKH